MIASLKILFNTKGTFDYLDNKYEDELNSNCNLIFLIVGAFSGLAAPELRPGETIEMYGKIGIILFYIISMAFGAMMGLLLGRYLITYLLYFIGKLLKGNGEVIDHRVVIAYSMIPRLLQIPLIIYIGFSNGIIEPYSSIYWLIATFYIITWIWMLKIMIQGVLYFNKYQIWKSIVNVSPNLIIGFVTFYFYYLYSIL